MQGNVIIYYLEWIERHFFFLGGGGGRGGGGLCCVREGHWGFSDNSSKI